MKSAVAIVVAAAIGLPAAIFLWGRVIDRYSTPEVLQQHLADAEEAMGEERYRDALAAYEFAAQLSPRDPDIHLHMMRARLMWLADFPGLITNNNRRSLTYQARFLTDHGKADWRVKVAFGHLYSSARQYKDAREMYEAAVAENPGAALAHAVLGNFHMIGGDGDEAAAAEYQKAIEIEPENRTALYGLGTIDFRAQDWQGAMEKLGAAVAQADDFEARMMIGQAAVKLNEGDDAIKSFLAAVRLDPKNVRALRSLGETLLAANLPAKAEPWLTRAYELLADPTIATSLGFAQLRQKKAGDALKTFGAVLQREPSAYMALWGAASAADALKNKEVAARLYQRFAQLDPPPGENADGAAKLKQAAIGRLQQLTGRAPAPGAPAAAPAPKPAAPATGDGGQ